MKKLILVLLILIPLACSESETLGLLEYRVLANKPGFILTYTNEQLRSVEENVDDLVWSINFPFLSGSAAALNALGHETGQELTAEIWYQGVKVATDTDSADFPFVNIVVPI